MSVLRPISKPIALYVHWPYCRRICPYCDFNVVRDRGRLAEQSALGEAILRDLSIQAKTALRDGPRHLVSLFFGGGTPSLMSPDLVAKIIARAKSLFPPQGNHPVEITLEANPTDAESARYQELAKAGITRLSLGVQALDEASLKRLGRDHSAEEAIRAGRLARAAFERLSIDLIYARPNQSVADWTTELETALGVFDPEHVSPYQLTIESGTAFERAVRRKTLVPPADDLAAALFETTQTVLEHHGFHAYEVSNHAKGVAARSVHNLTIWEGTDYLGLGPGAHGRVTLGGVRHATEAHRAIKTYIEAVETSGTGLSQNEALSLEDAAMERAMLGLRIETGLSFSELSPLGLTEQEPRVQELMEAGLLRGLDHPQTSARHLATTPHGRLVLDRILARLLT